MKNNKGSISTVIVAIVGFFLIAVIIGVFSVSKVPKSVSDVKQENALKKTTTILNPSNRPTFGAKKNYNTSSNQNCGIFLTSPFSNQRIVGKTIFINGTVNGCGWEPVDTFIGSAVLYDQNNNPLSNNATLSTSPNTVSSSHFFQGVVNIAVPYRGAATLVITNAGSTSATQKSIRIPLTVQSSIY